jgi:formate dehydrogenase subunit delta
MNAEHLVTMANQIAAFFESQGDADRAAAGTAQHLAKFWERRMIAAIQHHVDQGADGLAPVALAAIRQLPRKEAA